VAVKTVACMILLCCYCCFDVMADDDSDYCKLR